MKIGNLDERRIANIALLNDNRSTTNIEKPIKHQSLHKKKPLYNLQSKQIHRNKNKNKNENETNTTPANSSKHCKRPLRAEDPNSPHKQARLE